MWNQILFITFKMNFNFNPHSNYSEITSNYPESSQSININKPQFISSIKATDITKRDSIQVSSHDARKVVLSSQMEGLGTRFIEKSLSKPKQKLEFIRTLLIDNYDSYTYNIYQELSVVNGCKLHLFLIFFIIIEKFHKRVKVLHVISFHILFSASCCGEK